MTLFARLSLCLLACAALAACETINEKRKVDYKAAASRSLPPLEVPPDLSAPDAAAPSGTSSTTLSDFNKKDPLPTAALPQALLPQFPDMRIERDSQTRWLVVQAAPETLWPRVREFVSSVGLLIERENPTTAVIETNWAENRTKAGTGDQTLLAKWLSTLYSTGTRDRFRIHLERGAQAGTTEIYIAHHGMEEVVSHASSGGEADATHWQSRPSDPGIELEMLRLLMQHLGKPEEQAKRVAAGQTSAPPLAERAHLARDGGKVSLSVDDSIERAWRRVGLSLDRSAFTVEDRDRSKGIYYVRYIDPDLESERPGFWSRLFGASDKKIEERFQVQLEAAAAGTRVAVKTKDGAPEASKTGERILTLLYEQLK